MALTFVQRLQIDARARKEWYGVLSSMTDDKTRIPVSAALRKMIEEFKAQRHPMGPLVGELIKRMTGGSSASGSLRMGDSLKGLVPANEATMVKAGEELGDISRGLRQAAYYVGSTDGLVSQVRTATSLSMTYLMILFALYAFFAIELLPQMEAVNKRVNWPVAAQRFGFVSDHIFIIGGIVACLVAVVWFLVKWLARNWTGRGRDFADRYIWPFTTIRLMNASGMLLGLSGFIQAGSPFDAAIGHMAEAADPYMLDKYKGIRRAGKSGKEDFNALLSVGLIPDDRAWIIRCYGETADFGLAIEKIAREFVEYATEKTERLAKRLNLFLMGFVALNIGWVAMTVASIVKSVK